MAGAESASPESVTYELHGFSHAKKSEPLSTSKAREHEMYKTTLVVNWN